MSDLLSLDTAIAAAHEAKPLNPPVPDSPEEIFGTQYWDYGDDGWYPNRAWSSDPVAAKILKQEILDAGWWYMIETGKSGSQFNIYHATLMEKTQARGADDEESVARGWLAWVQLRKKLRASELEVTDGK